MNQKERNEIIDFAISNHWVGLSEASILSEKDLIIIKDSIGFARWKINKDMNKLNVDCKKEGLKILNKIMFWKT